MGLDWSENRSVQRHLHNYQAYSTIHAACDKGVGKQEIEEAVS
jgi:hypothetical protein